MTMSYGGREVFGDALSAFIALHGGGEGGEWDAAPGGAVLTAPQSFGGAAFVGEYTWGGAASNTFFVAPALGLDAIFMTQLFPAGGLRLHDLLKEAVAGALIA